MGKPVTLDSDDVEALLLAAELSAAIEQKFLSVRQDPAFQRLAGRMRDAADRARRLRGDAIRIEEPFNRANLTAKMIAYMWALDPGINPNWEPPGIDPETSVERNYLLRHNLVVMGQIFRVVKWGDKTVHEQPYDTLAIKLTKRGQDILHSLSA